MVRLKQRNDESVECFVQRLRDVKNKCYSLDLDDRHLADLAFQGLLPHIRDKYASQEFESLSHLVQRISSRGRNYEFSLPIVATSTNNQAEYQALIKGLELLKEVHADTVEIFGDSLLVINQLARSYEC